jgi:hypothetical protein
MRWVVAGALLALVLWPATWAPPRDGFPLSSYPMFAYGRRDEVLPVNHVVEVRADGTRAPVPPRVVGNGSVMQAAGMTGSAIRSGGAAVLCRQVAARLGRTARLEVATDWFHVLRYFDGETAPVRRKVHATCASD